MKISKCRSCGASIIWAITERGKAAPFDCVETDDGTVSLREVKGVVYAVTPIFSTAKLHKSHFASCPNAAAHRKPRAGAASG